MLLKKHFDISIRLSLFLIFIILLSLFCTNCSSETQRLEKPSLDDDIDSDTDDDNDTDGDDGTDDDGTDNDSDEDEFDPSTFSWEDVHFLNGGVIVSQDISGWSETSRIKSFSMSSNGICVDHNMKNNWSTIIHPGYSNEPLEVQGSPWIFIPMDDGKVYATVYEHLRSANDPVMGGNGGQVCKLGVGQNTLAEVISNLVDHAKAIHLEGQAQRDAIAPIQDWYPQPGDILGFAVSTYGREPRDYRSGSLNERSDIVWIRVPDYNAVNKGGEIVGRSSDSSTTTTSTTTSSTTPDFTSPKQIPDLHNVVRRLAQQHPEALRNLGGNPFSWGDYVYNQQSNVQSMEFLDRVIQKLHSIDPRFGYIRKHSGRHDEFFGPDDIAYYEGVGNPQSKNMNQGTVFVDHIVVGGNPNTIHGWVKVTDYPEDIKPLAQWIYPRPGAPNYGYDPNHPGSVVR